MPTSVPYSTTSGQTLFVHIRHKTGNVNNDRHFYNLKKDPILEYKFTLVVIRMWRKNAKKCEY